MSYTEDFPMNLCRELEKQLKNLGHFRILSDVVRLKDNAQSGRGILVNSLVDSYDNFRRNKYVY